MRKVMFSLLLAATGAIGLAGSAPAEARDSRIYVGIGDVSFSYGRPHWRYNNEPLYVVYERGYPRYYRVAAPVYYAPPPRYVYAPPRAYRYDRYDRYHRYDRHDRRGRGYRGRHWD